MSSAQSGATLTPPLIDASSPSTPLTHPVRPQTGHIVIKGELWTAGPDGRLRDDITGAMTSCRVRWTWDDAIPGTLDARVRGRDVTDAITDCLVPILTVQWWDRYGHGYEVRERLGLFFYLPPDRDFDRLEQESIITGYDTTWALGQMTLGRSFTIAPGSAYLGLWARDMYLSGGPMALRHSFPQTAVRAQKLTTYAANKNVRESMNELYSRAGHWPVVSDRTGRLLTTPRLLTGDQRPSRSIRSREYDVLMPNAIQFRPDREAFCTEVSLSSNNPEDTPQLRDGYKATFTDPNSPYSRQRLGYVVAAPPIQDDRSETFDVMRNRCLALLEQASSMLGRYTIAVWPDPRFLPREVWDVEIEQDNGNPVTSGKHRVESMTFGFSENAGAQICTIGRVRPVVEFT